MHKALCFYRVLGFSALVLSCGAGPRPTAPADNAQARADSAAHSLDAAAPQRDAESSERDAGGRSESNSPQDTATAECDAAKCERKGDELAQSLMTSSNDVTTVMGGDCTRVDIVGVVAGLACTCLTSNGWIYLGPDGAGCFARGRAGDCLWDDSDVKACTRGDPTCPAACRELGTRFAADAAKSFDVAVRSSACREGSCRHVLRVENACYTERSIRSGRRFDCDLSDSEILDSEDTTH